MGVKSVEYLDGSKESGKELTRAGHARVTYEDGEVFEGTFVQSNDSLVKEGHCRYHWASGAEYEGSYKAGKKNGEGRYVFPNGDVYKGSWKDGVKCGNGVYTFTNGDVFKGHWDNDMRSGEGVYTYKNSGAVLEGTWENGEFATGRWRKGDARMSTATVKKSLRNLSSRLSKRKPSEKNTPLGIIISGAPASGKGTQCELIREKYGVVHLSTGDMLRAAVAAGTPVGKQAKELMESGQLVSDDLVIQAVKERLNQEDVKKHGFLLDGFPRTEAQAKALGELGFKVDVFLMLHVPDELLVERVIGRRIDPHTGNSYHVSFNPPPEEIENRVIQRADDTEEKVRVRLQHFHGNINSVKNFYSDKVVDVHGHHPKEHVWSQIHKALGSFL